MSKQQTPQCGYSLCKNFEDP